MADSDSQPPVVVDEKKAAVETSKTATRPPLKSGSSHANMNGPLYMQSGNNVVLVRRLKRKEQDTWKSLARWFVENQTGMSQHWLSISVQVDMAINGAFRRCVWDEL